MPADDKPSRPSGDGCAVVEAHWMVLDVGAAAETRFRAMLVADEQRRARRFRIPRTCLHYVVRRGRLRELLADRLGCAPQEVPLSYNGFGKPEIRGTDLQFNLSHSQGVALYVIARGVEVGCDIEWRRPGLAKQDVARHFFSERELRLLAAVAPERWVEGFFNCWTRKEALVKALGFGLSYPLEEFDVSVAPDEPAALLRGPPECSIRSLDDVAGLHAAIAARSGSMRIESSKAPDLRA